MEEVIRIPLPGINNKTQLLEIAKALHQEVGRGEIKGSVSTKSLTSFGGSNQDPDLLTLKVGDPIEIVTAATALGSHPPLVAEYISHAQRSQQQEIDVLTKRLGNQNLATLIVQAKQNLQRAFRVSQVKYSWDANSGISIDAEFQNYVEARSGGTVP